MRLPYFNRRGAGPRGRPPWPVLLTLAAMLLPAAGPGMAGAGAGMSQARVSLAGKAFAVDVADTPELQRLGLGGRKRLGPYDGMLFVYAGKARRSFWMKGMVISIDIIWLDNDRIIHIEHRVPPPKPGTPLRALPTYAAAGPANGVLEIAAGRAAELGLRVGDYARFAFN